MQYSRTLAQATVNARADVVFYGAFQYNDANTIGQDAYSLVNIRVGVTRRALIGEVLATASRITDGNADSWMRHDLEAFFTICSWTQPG